MHCLALSLATRRAPTTVNSHPNFTALLLPVLMSSNPHTLSGDPPVVPNTPLSHPEPSEQDPDFSHNPQQMRQDLQLTHLPNDNNNNPHVIPTCPLSKQHIARKLQRIDILLNLIYSRVANDRSLKALLPYIPEHQARNLLSNFAYVRHHQDTQEINPKMTDKQTYRIFRHHYRAEQRLSGALRELRHSTTQIHSHQLQEKPPQSKPLEISSPLARAVTDLENRTAQMRIHHLTQAESELHELSTAYQGDDDLLYMQEFSQPQQIATMQGRCVSMKDEYEAEDLRVRNDHYRTNVSDVKRTPNITVSGPEEWEDYPPHARETDSTVPEFMVLNGEWTPPDPPRSPCPNGPESHRVAPDAKHVTLGNAEHTSRVYHRPNLSLPFSREHRQRKLRRETGNGLPEYRQDRMDKKIFRKPENLDKKVHLSSQLERRGRRGSSSRTFRGTSPQRKSAWQLEDIHSMQQRYSGNRPPLPDRNPVWRHHRGSRRTQVTPKRPGPSLRASRVHVNPKNSFVLTNHGTSGESRYHYSNVEYASLPNLHRTSVAHKKETSYDDVHTGSGQNHYGRGHRLDPSRNPFPHESTDALGWKPQEGTTGRQYHSGLTHEQPAPLYAQPRDQQGQLNLAAPSLPQGSLPRVEVPTHSAAQAPGATETRKRDEWRYNRGLSSGLLETKEGLGVMKSLANKVKGKKRKETVPHNPIEVMQLARKDPVKFMTTMVAGEVMPQAKRKAQKLEYMLTNESKADGISGPVGKVLTKVAKQSLTHGASSKTGVAGEVGQMLTKMTLDSAVGGPSKANATSDVGNVLSKVAKESLKNAGGSSGGAKMIKQVMHSLANT